MVVIRMSEPLRYNISDWHQLTECQSNNSRDLQICVGDFIQDSRLVGLRIQVWHADFGILFACVLNTRGSLVSELSTNIAYELTTDQILSELKKYGFIVTYEPRRHLPESQLSYLRTLKELGYDKIRIIPVYIIEHGTKITKPYIVAFYIKDNVRWLDNMYCSPKTEFHTSLENGSAINISAISATNNWSWTWLDYVANIDDILSDNT